MTWTTDKPTASGYYWIWPDRHNEPEIVTVAMDYTVRNKVVPMVIGPYWKDPLEKWSPTTRWSGPILPPT